MTVPPPKKVKIGPKTIGCILIRNAHNSAANRFLVHELNIPDIHKNAIRELRNASLFDDVFPCRSKEKASSLKRGLKTIQENSQNRNNDGEVESRCNKRLRTEKKFGLDFLTYVVTPQIMP